jgi:hypothetical protein
MRKVFISLTCFFLVLLAGLIVYVEAFADRHRRFDRKLSEIVPAKVEGWRAEELPLAATEGMLEHVNKVLQFDDSVQRVYTQGDTQVIVYAAYWTPGKVTTADAGTHNPDSCWVAAGMNRTERLYSQSGDVLGRPLLPYEYGAYAKDGRVTYVMFWHLVQGVPQRYESQKEGWRNGLAGRLERLPLVLDDIRRYGLNQKREQLFVRISANKPLETLRADPAFDRLLGSVDSLGVFKDKSWAETEPGK